MVICRCGCKFDNSSLDSHVMCPKCKRIYPNSAPDMVHPKSVDELMWDCPECNAPNDCSYAGAPRRSCAKCGAKRPGNPEEWYGIWQICDKARHGAHLKGMLERYFK